MKTIEKYALIGGGLALAYLIFVKNSASYTGKATGEAVSGLIGGTTTGIVEGALQEGTNLGKWLKENYGIGNPFIQDYKAEQNLCVETPTGQVCKTFALGTPQSVSDEYFKQFLPKESEVPKDYKGSTIKDTPATPSKTITAPIMIKTSPQAKVETAKATLLGNISPQKQVAIALGVPTAAINKNVGAVGGTFRSNKGTIASSWAEAKLLDKLGK